MHCASNAYEEHTDIERNVHSFPVIDAQNQPDDGNTQM